MDLKDFVVSAISDIAQAVTAADDEIRPLGGLVNPGLHTKDKDFVAPRTTLNFDIAVSAAKSEEASGGASARIWVVEASLGGKGEATNETVSRLTFSLDVVLPHDTEQAERIGKVRSS
ncbi:trypco2 family protein [Marinovum sp.]|uniref:trypco2 family protein n=1 Tax=Marinovum sp. TaxID=2024839 RepID=UPI003A8DC479